MSLHVKLAPSQRVWPLVDLHCAPIQLGQNLTENVPTSGHLSQRCFQFTTSSPAKERNAKFQIIKGRIWTQIYLVTHHRLLKFKGGVTLMAHTPGTISAQQTTYLPWCALVRWRCLEILSSNRGVFLSTGTLNSESCPSHHFYFYMTTCELCVRRQGFGQRVTECTTAFGHCKQ